MAPNKVTAMLGSFVTIVALAAVASAETPEPRRGGFFVGFGVGGGIARPDAGVDYEGGGTGSFRIGYAPMDEFTIGLESVSWVSSVNGVDWTFSVAGAGGTYYPGNTGFFGKLGVGLASIEAKVSSVSVSESGFGVLAGTGFEQRLTRKFALGIEVDYAYLNVGDDIDSASVINGNVIFNWYWSHAE